MDCNAKDHLWEYRWESEYRRCKRKGCQRSEWRSGGLWVNGPRCNIVSYHELSMRANGGVKTRPRVDSTKLIGQTKGYAADRRLWQEQAERDFFLRQKELMKSL